MSQNPTVSFLHFISCLLSLSLLISEPSLAKNQVGDSGQHPLCRGVLAAEPTPARYEVKSTAESAWRFPSWVTTEILPATASTPHPLRRFHVPKTPQHSVVIYHPVERSPSSTAFGVKFTIRLQGWEDLRYVAYGWQDDQRFWHLRSKHLLQGDMYRVEIEPDSLAFLLNNRWQTPATWELRNLRIVVRGKPETTGASLDIGPVAVEPSSVFGIYPIETEKCAITSDSFRSWYRDLEPSQGRGLMKQWREAGLVDLDGAVPAAKSLRERGELKLSPEMPIISGDPLTFRPAEVDQSTALRFRWHSLAMVPLLITAYHETGEAEYLWLARDYVQRWSSRNFDSLSNDFKYAWYDHGTANRLFAFLALWDEGVEHRFSVQFMERLFYLIIKHSELLADPSFYVRNQPLRAHNHAIFQDLALLATTTTVPSLPVFDQWRQLSLSRLNWQFHALVTAEGASIENSLGYHVALEKMCQGVIDFLSDSIQPAAAQRLSSICQRMEVFRKSIEYPDHTGPAFGDTWRAPSPKQKQPHWRTTIQRATHVYEQSGYAAVTIPPASSMPGWQLDFINSSESITHKHQDYLSFTLWIDGREWLIDPGYYAIRNHPLDSYGRSAKAHNTFLACGALYEPAIGVTTLERVVERREFLRLTAKHRAYPDRIAKRDLSIWKEEGIILLSDEISKTCSMEASHELWFHFGEKTSISQMENQLILAEYGSRQLALGLPIDAECSVLEGKLEPSPAGWFFPTYGQAIASPSLRCRLPGDRLRWSTWILVAPTQEQIKNPNRIRQDLLNLDYRAKP